MKQKYQSGFLRGSSLGLCFVLAAFVSFSARGSELAPKKGSVKVYAKPSKKSKVLVKLKKGDSVSEQGRKGMYWKVKLDSGETGYVSVMKVSRKLAGKSAGFSSALRKAVQQGRSVDDASNIRNRSAVMGVRGLDESGDVSFAGNVKPNPRLVLSMENLMIAPEKVDFLGSMVERELEKNMNKR